MDDKRLDELIGSVVDTFKFHGAEIKEVSLTPSGIPCFKVILKKSEMKKSLDRTLDFIYWTLWTLSYGQYTDEKKSLEINLLYEEV